MLPTQVKQICPKCKGTGTGKRVLKVKDQVMLAPAYHDKNDISRPQYENCDECDGEGRSLQPPPTIIYEEGKKTEISLEEARKRYEVAA